MRKTTLTNEQMIAKLWCAVQEAGTQKALAKKLGISEVYLSDILAGRREISRQVAETIGYMRLTVFVPEG